MMADKRGQFYVGDSKETPDARSPEYLANYYSTYHLDDLKRMFESSIDADVIEMIWQESSEDGQAAYEMLLAMDDGPRKQVNREPALMAAGGSFKQQSAYEMEQPMQEHIPPAATWAGIFKQPAAKVQTGGSFSLSPFAEPFVDPRSTKPKLEATIDKKTAVDVVKERSWRGEKLVILMRGVPGSGKSTLASQVKAKGVVLSTDDFFVNRIGEYVFNPILLPEAHQWNQKRAENEIKQGTYPIIIDNTNLESWELQPYICLAIKYNYGVVLMEPETPWRYDARILSQKNRHQVSREKIRQMLEKLNVPFDLEHLIEECRRRMPKSGSVESRKPSNSVPDKNLDNCDSVIETRQKTAMNNWEAQLTQSCNVICNNVAESESASEDLFQRNSWCKNNLQTASKSVEETCPDDLQSTQLSIRDVGVQTCNSDPVLRVVTAQNRSINTKFMQDYSSKRPKLKLTLDKSCSTEEIEQDLASKKALSILKGYFPAMDPKDLADVLDKCQGDLTWTVNLLLDSGYQCSGQVNEDQAVEEVTAVEEFKEEDPQSESEEPPTGEPAENATDLPGSVDIVDTESLRRYVQDCFVLTDTISDHTRRICGKDYNQFRASQLHKSRQTQFESFQHLLPPEYQMAPDQQLALISNDLSETLVAADSSAQDAMTEDMKNNEPLISMTLDHAFAKQLINLFGDPYAGKSSRRSTATGSNTFDISWSLAEQIYLHWLSSLYDEDGDGDDDGDVHVADATTNDFEFAMQLVQQEKDAERQQLRESLATKLSLQNLRESYPHIDPLALNALFEANNYNYANTITAVNVFLGTKPKTDPSTRIISSAPSQLAKDAKEDSAASNKSVAPAKVGDDQDARSEAFMYKRLQREYAAKAVENHQRGMHAVSTYYATESRRYGDLYREANQAAALQIVEKKNINCDEKTIDLHELKVIEALSFLESFIADNIKDGKRVIQIITGKGNHSVNGRPRIKPAVITFLKKKKYGFEELNPGMLRVYLRR